MMIGYVTLGTNNLDAAAKFYDELLAEMGAKRFMDMETFIAWSASPGKPSLAIAKPFNKEAATVGNGTMVALMADSHDKVNAIYEKAIALGATGLVVMSVGGLESLKTASLVVGVPLVFLMGISIVSLLRWLKQDYPLLNSDSLAEATQLETTDEQAALAMNNKPLTEGS